MKKIHTDINSSEVGKTKPYLEVGEYSDDVSETALAGKIDRYPTEDRDMVIIRFYL